MLSSIIKTSTARVTVAFSEGRPRFESLETTTPHHEEPVELGPPIDYRVKTGNFKLIVHPKQDQN